MSSISKGTLDVACSWMTDFIFPRVMRQVLVTTAKDRVEVERHRSRKAEKQRSRKSKTQKSREAEKREPRKAEKQKSTETEKAGKSKKKPEKQKGREAGNSNSGETEKQRSRNQTKPYQNLIPKINNLPLTIPQIPLTSVVYHHIPY